MGSSDEFEFHTFHVNGVSRPEIIYIEHGLYELVEGRLFTNEEINPYVIPSIAPILVSREFAQSNDLSIGSYMELKSMPIFVLPEDANVPEGGFTDMEWGEELWNHPYNQAQEVIYEFEIVGIFDVTRILRGNIEELMDHQNMVNLFFTPNWRVYEAISDEANSWQLWADVFNMHDWNEGLVSILQAQADSITALWLLHDWEDVATFMEAANQILPPSLEVDEGLMDTFRPMIEATNSLNTIVSRVLWLASGAMVMVLTLLILLYLRERRHEIGIYLALGEKKVKIMLQLLLEIVIVSTLGLIMAFLVANMLSEQLSLSILQTELASNERSDDHIPVMLERLGFGQALAPDEMLAFFEVSLDMEAVILFFLGGLGTVTLSTVVPVVYIMEINPKEILMQAKVE
jgi:putative ABC transport system permease protein